jgi:hypothetical protein
MDYSKVSNPYRVNVAGDVTKRNTPSPIAELTAEAFSKDTIHFPSRPDQQSVANTNKNTSKNASPSNSKVTIDNCLNFTPGAEVMNPYKKPQRIEGNTVRNVANPYQKKRRISFTTPLVSTKKNTVMQPKSKVRNPYLKQGVALLKSSHQQQNLSVASVKVHTPAKDRDRVSIRDRTRSPSDVGCGDSQNQQENVPFDYGLGWNTDTDNQTLKVNGRKRPLPASNTGKANISNAHSSKWPPSNERGHSHLISSKSAFLRTRLSPDYNSTLVTPTRSPLVKTSYRYSPQPTMMFLIEAINKAKSDCILHRSNALIAPIPQSPHYVQIYGIAVSEPMSTPYNSQTYFAFCFDDGTAMIDALYMDHSHQNNNDCQDRVKEKVLLSLNLPMLIRKVTTGARIECRGYIQYPPSRPQNSHESQSKANPCFIVDSIAFVTDPNLEALRVAQISYLKKYPHSAVGGSAVPQRLDDKMYVFGSPQDKPLQEKSSNDSADRERIIHLISLSKPKGLSCDELQLLLSVQTQKSDRKLQNELKLLQDDFEIYVSRDGSFLPM